MKRGACIALALAVSWAAWPTTAGPPRKLVLDPRFGEGGIATMTWPLSGAQPWSRVEAYATRQLDGRWATALFQADGATNVVNVAWFEPNGRPTPAQPGAGAYTPMGLPFPNVTFAGLVRASDGGLSYGGSFPFNGNADDIDFLLRRGNADGSFGYAGCTGGFQRSYGFDLNTTRPDDYAYAHIAGVGGTELLGGQAFSGGDETRAAILRLRFDCVLDATFGTQGKLVLDFNPFLVGAPPRRSRVRSLAIDRSARILVGGGVTYSTSATGNGACVVARLLGNGDRDGSFGRNGAIYLDSPTTTPGNWVCDVRGLVEQPDGRIVLLVEGILYTSSGPYSGWAFMRLLPDGSGDASLTGFTSALVGDGRLLSRSLARLVDGTLAVAPTKVPTAGGGTTGRIQLVTTSGDFLSLPEWDNDLPLQSGPNGVAALIVHGIHAEPDGGMTVVASSGPDTQRFHAIHLLRYVADRVFLGVFD